jgi:hypothetical protein
VSSVNPYHSVVTVQDDRVGSRWLNDEAVRKAIHARPVSFNYQEIFEFSQKFRTRPTEVNM